MRKFFLALSIFVLIALISAGMYQRIEESRTKDEYSIKDGKTNTNNEI